MHPIFRKHKRRMITLVCCIGAVFLIILSCYFIRKNRYEYIDLPIVLGNEADVVQVIRDGMTARNPRITITFTAKGEYTDQLFTLTDSLVRKALAPTSDPKQGDYLRFQYGGYRLHYKNSPNTDGTHEYTLEISPSYYTTAGREEAVDAEVASFLENAGFSRKTTDYEKIKSIHDYLVAHCEYDWRNSKLQHRYVKSTAYGALVNGEASCQGYSVAMYRLLMEAGIQNRIITGNATSPQTGETEYHAWNLVLLNGTWYNIDVSWDDQTDSYDYFLKSDASFSSHVREQEYDDDTFRQQYPTSPEDYA